MSARTSSRSSRTSSRHRSDAPAATPLTGAVQAIAATAPASAARSGAVLVVSSGLVAGVGLPAADAAGSKPAGDANTATLTLPAVTDNVVQAPVSAPATAQVKFERSALTAAGRHQGTASTAGVDSAARTAAGVVHASRAAARAAYREQVAHAAKLEQARRDAAAARTRSTASVSRSSTRTTGTSTSTRTSTAPAPKSNGSRGASVIAIASRYFGVPYVYGGTTPRGFDCSGFVQYVYAQLGVHLPRTTNQQYAVVTRIPRSQAQPGDLVFFYGGGGISHMGIYAGDGMMIAAPRTGSVVKKQPIYSANVAFGRV